MSSYDSEIVKQLKRINEQLETISVMQVTMMNAFCLMNMANTDGEVQENWKSIQKINAEMLKKAINK